MIVGRSQIIGRTLAEAETELRRRFGEWTTLHEGMPGNVDRDPLRVNVWVDEEGKISRLTRG